MRGQSKQALSLAEGQRLVLREGGYLTLRSGQLTLVNPASMTRQVFEAAAQKGTGPFGHITSLSLLRPENVAEAWEAAALRERKDLLLQSQTVARVGHYVLEIPAGTWSCSVTLDEIFGIGPAHTRTVAGWLGLIHPDESEEMRRYLGESVLRNLEQMLVRVIGENIGLKFLLAASPGRVKADPGQIEQVVTNLVLNARDAMPLGGSLTVETADVELDADYAAGHRGAVAGSYVMLALADTGGGMDQAVKDRLFDLNIPGTSGERVLRDIRAAGHNTPAIVLTGDAASADMEVLRPLGAVRVLEKSSDGEPLLQAIEAVPRRDG